MDRGGVGSLGSTWEYLRGIANSLSLDASRYITQYDDPRIRVEALASDIRIRIGFLRHDKESSQSERDKLQRRTAHLERVLSHLTTDFEKNQEPPWNANGNDDIDQGTTGGD